ncbi:hypothetical protein IQ268_28320 [Oculatella sp. LEGE 06141]|uniref:hypothetical protein n=1 Tax=Oculatella sp. LEGE 06141 TaxID=1828648 RepID=UPI00187FFC5D|nr:hypothetical protein [Oculatella sp. LEGE 06141]MBE9182459.1 hypothetical protein [Oculatella sp. LEGE 06141]
MDRTFDATDVQAIYEPAATNFTPMSDRSYVPSHEDAANGKSDGCEQAIPPLTPVDELLKIDHWKPTEPQFCKEIVAHYPMGKRTIQKWFIELREIAPWFSESELRLSDDRYTPLAVELLGHRYFAGSKKKWESVLQELFADRVETWNSAQSTPAVRPEVLPREDQHPSDGNGDCPSGLTLHIGSSLAVPAIPGIVTPADDTAYLTQVQQRMSEFEALQQKAIAQMQEQYQQVQALNAQYQEATSLGDQLLLQEFQLKGIQLGYTALQLKQQAFKATVQAAEAGTLPVPGKPDAEDGQPQSA